MLPRTLQAGKGAPEYQANTGLFSQRLQERFSQPVIPYRPPAVDDPGPAVDLGQCRARWKYQRNGEKDQGS